MPNRGKVPAWSGSTIARLLGAGAVAGLLVSAIAFPAVGGAGIGIRTAADELNLKPEELKEPPLAEKSTVLDARGKPIAQFWDQYREVVKLDEIADVMKDAIISIEDERFYEHGAIDVEGTLRAFVKNITSGGVSEGGSGITQQLVKQILLNQAETEEEKSAAVATSYARKLNEVRHAMAIEQKYTKDEILEKYLNIAYFGASANGVEAAAKRFFGKKASELDLAEAATLAGAVQDPNRTDPARGKKFRDRLLARRNIVIDKMASLGKISQEEAAEAKKKKLGYKGTALPGNCGDSDYPYFCLYVRYEILNNPVFGKTPKSRLRLLNRGGLTIKTTIDPKMQAAAEKVIKKYVHASDKPVASQALIEPGTGAIKAMAASRNYGTNKRKNEMSYNVVADAAHGGGSGFQNGSTNKVFALVTALKKGMKLNDGISTGAGYRAPGYSAFKNCKGENIGDPSHTVTNADGGGAGFYSLQTGIWKSANTFFMALEQRVGLCDTIRTAKSLGLKRSDGQNLQEYSTFVLGTNETDPVTVANAYASIAARGKYCRPMAITEITDQEGNTTKYRPQCKQVLDPEIADATSDILQGVFTKGTMSGVGGIGRPAAGKTGTTDAYATAWFAGYTPNLAGAVSIGDPRGSAKYRLSGVTIGGRYYPSVFGSSIPGPIWKETFIAALKGVPVEKFHPVNTARFGGCSSSCQPVRRDPDRGGDGGGGDAGGGDRGAGNGGAGNGGGGDTGGGGGGEQQLQEGGDE